MAPRKSTARKSRARKTSTAKSSTRKASAAKIVAAKAPAKAAIEAAVKGADAPRAEVKPATTPAPAAAPKPTVQGVALADAAGPAILRKKQLIDEVVARSGIKKKDAKPVVEAMLAVLGEAVAAGTTLNLQPLGKLTVQKQNQKPTARVTVARIRQSTAAGARAAAGTEARKLARTAAGAIVGKDPLASAAE